MYSEANLTSNPPGIPHSVGVKPVFNSPPQKSRFMNFKNNQLRIHPLAENSQIEEENSVYEKETPGIDFNINSPNKIDFFSNEKKDLKILKPQQNRDMYNRHYSVDASKLQFQSLNFDNLLLRSPHGEQEGQDELEGRKLLFNKNQNVNSNLIDRDGQNQFEKESDKKTTEVTEMYSGKNLIKFAIKNQRGEAKKRHSEYITPTSKLGQFGMSNRITRRNGVAPSETNKQMLGRITFLNVQTAQNQALSESETQTLENQQAFNQNGNSSFMINKKLSLSWRFINILVLMQTLMNKMKIMSQTHRYNKLNESHYVYINDKTNIQSERKSIYKNHMLNIQEFIQDLRLFKWISRFEVLKPEYVVVIFWKTFMLVILVSQLLYIPIKISFFNFDPNLTGTYQILLNRLPLAACICDILINFNLAFFSAEGVVVQDRAGIITNYLRFPFWLDLITTISLTLQEFQYPDLCFLFRIFQILEIINYLDERFQLSQRFNTPFTLIKLIATIIILAHIFGCGFYYMSLYDHDYNWVESVNLQNKSWGTLYLKSLYFIVITMITVGFGDITPKNNAETIYILGIALLSCFQFGYTVNIIGSLFQEKAQKEAIIKAQKYQISTYMRQRMINTSLQTLVLKNLDYIQTQQIDAPEQGLSILDKVSENLKNQVRFDFYWRILKDQPLLNYYFSQSFLKQLTNVMTERTYIPGEYVYQINQTSHKNSLYILIKGQVDLTIHSLQEKNSKKKFIIQSKKPGDFFGHHSFFTSKPRETDCECLVTSHVVACTQESFIKIAKEFPYDYEKYCFLRDQILLYQNDKNMKCVACQKFGHCVIDCPFIHLVNYKSIIIHKFNYSEDNKRDLDYVRKQQKHSTLSKLISTKNDLKKIRIKLIKQMEQIKEKKQRKSVQPIGVGVGNFLQSKTFISSNLNDIEDDSSLDSSDLSDYRYELQLEEEKLLLKRQHQDFPYLTSYFDKQFYERHPKIKFNDRQMILKSSSSDHYSNESKTESTDSEGTVFMNNINLNQSLNDFDDGISQTEIHDLHHHKKNLQAKYHNEQSSSKLNNKIAQILRYNQKDINQSIQNKNLRSRKIARPDSAPQRKSIIDDVMQIKGITGQTSINKIQGKQRPSSVKVQTKTYFEDDLIEEPQVINKYNSHTNFFTPKKLNINQARSSLQNTIDMNNLQIPKKTNNKAKHSLEKSLDQSIPNKILQLNKEAVEERKKRNSDDYKLSKSQILSEESHNSSNSSSENNFNTNNHHKQYIQPSKASHTSLEEKTKRKISIRQEMFNLKKSSSKEINLRVSKKSILSIESKLDKDDHQIKINTISEPNNMKGIRLNSPTNLKQIYQKNSKNKVNPNKQFITSIKGKNLQKIDLIRKHLQEDSDEDFQTKDHFKQYQLKNHLNVNSKESIKFKSSKQDLSSVNFTSKHSKEAKNELFPPFNIMKVSQSFYKIEEGEPSLGKLNSKSQTIQLSKKDKIKSHSNSSNNNNNNGHQQFDKKEQYKSNQNSSMNKSQKLQTSPMDQSLIINDQVIQGPSTSLKDKDKVIKEQSNNMNNNHNINNQHEPDDNNKIDLFSSNLFEKMKIYKVYYPNNNVTNVLESYAKYSIKKFLINRGAGGSSTKNQSSIVPVIGHSLNAFNFVNVLKKRLLNKQHRHSVMQSLPQQQQQQQ